MKLKYEFSVREIAGDYVLIPLGEAALELSGMSTTNDVGVFICEQLQNDITEQCLVEKIVREFEVDEEEATKDLIEFLQQADYRGMVEREVRI